MHPGFFTSGHQLNELGQARADHKDPRSVPNCLIQPFDPAFLPMLLGENAVLRPSRA